MVQETIMELTVNIKHKIWQWYWERGPLFIEHHLILTTTLWVRDYYSYFINDKIEIHRGCESCPRLHVSYMGETVLKVALFWSIDQCFYIAQTHALCSLPCWDAYMDIQQWKLGRNHIPIPLGKNDSSVPTMLGLWLGTAEERIWPQLKS